MAFPTSGLVDNQVHKEGNRSFVYDSTLLVWDQAPEAPETISILGASTGLDDVTLGSSVVFPAGHVVQVVYYETSAFATGTSRMQDDNTIPQITEGDQYMSLAITPTSATNKLLVEVIHNTCGGYNGNQAVLGAIFNTHFHATNALGISYVGQSDGYKLNTTPIRIYVVAGRTTATTFLFRSGSGSAGTTHFNGVAGTGSGTARGNGTLFSSIRITEIKV